MKKILVVYDAMITGGTTTCIIPLLEAISSKYEVELLLGKNEGERLDDIPKSVKLLQEAHIKKDDISIPKKVMLLLTAIRSGLKYILFTKNIKFNEIKKYSLNSISVEILSRTIKTKYDVAIGFIEGWADQYISLHTNADKKIAWIHAQIDYIVSNPKLEYNWMKNIDKFVFVTESNKKKFDMMFPEYRDKSVVCENIVNEEEIKRDSLIIPNNEKYRHFADFNGLKIITVCRLTEHIKGIDRIVRCAKILKTQGVSFMWCILGDGRDRLTIAQNIKENDVGDCLFLYGNIENPFPYVKAADIFVLLSRFEGKPLCVTEALIVGTPPIVTNYPSAKEQIIHNENGFIMDNDEESIEKFIRLLASGGYDYLYLRKNLSNKPFRVEKSVGNIIKVIEE